MMKCPYKVFRNGRYFGARNPLWSRENPYEPRRFKRRTRELAKAELARLWGLFVKDEISVGGEPRRVLEALERRRRALGMEWVAFHAWLEARLDAPAAAEGASGLVVDLVERFLLTKRQRGVRARTDSDLKSRLKRFSQDFPGRIEEVTAAGVERWVGNLRNSKTGRALAPRTRNNFLAAVQNLFNSPGLKGSAQSRSIAELQEIQLEAPRKAIWSPRELLELLGEAHRSDHRVIPVLALGAFAGLRTKEALLLDAADLELAEGQAVIVAGKTKVKRERLLFLEANLIEWLKAFAPRSGPMWRGHENTFHRRVRKLAARAGLAWRNNALRHSAATYKAARGQEMRSLSADLGNSPVMIERHYLAARAARRKAAEAWFAICPGDVNQQYLLFPGVPKESPRARKAAVS